MYISPNIRVITILSLDLNVYIMLYLYKIIQKERMS